MKPSEAVELHRECIRQICTKYGLSNPRIFGSVAKGTDTENSDLDILVDAGPKTSLFDLNGAANELADMLGVEIDICTINMIRDAWKDDIRSISVLI